MRNPRLYKVLRKVIGETPRIVNPGEPCRLVNVYPEFSLVPRTEYLLASATPGGEQYAVSCPYCHDSRQRLYVSHMWDAEFVSQNCRYHCSDRLVHCFNEQCMDNPIHRQDLVNKLRLAMGEVTEIDENEISESESPQVNELAHQCKMPDDFKSLTDACTPIEVLTYLHERGFDPEWLATRWGVGWVPCHGKFAHPMIVIPVYQNGEFWFWQGRLVPLDGQPDGPLERDMTTGKPYPKYYFPHGVKKAWALYNLDKARTHETVFVVEGVTDAWAVGEAAVARFGKELSMAQLRLLTTQCFGKHIIIVPDSDDPQALDAARAEAMRMELQSAFASVKLSLLPEGIDPGDLIKRYDRKEDIECALKCAAISPSQVRTIPSICGSLETW